MGVLVNSNGKKIEKRLLRKTKVLRMVNFNPGNDKKIIVGIHFFAPLLKSCLLYFDVIASL